MVYSAKSTSSVVSQFTRRKKIHINSSADGALTDYQIKFTIAYESAMQADFDDIRFNETDGDYINSWLEDKTDSSTSDFWIKTDVPASGGKDIYMYYGNSSLATGTDGDNTFMQYSGDSDLPVYENDDIISPSNVIYESYIKRGNQANCNLLVGLSNTSSLSGDVISIQSYSTVNANRLNQYNNGSSTVTDSEAPVVSQDTYYRAKIVISTTVTCYIDNNMIQTGGDAIIANEAMSIWGNLYWGGSSAHQDWAFVRKYTANEPTTSISVEKHQRRVAQIIG